MKLYLLILLISTLFAGELEVDGDLTVTGGIVSPTIDALRDDGDYEYTVILVYTSIANDGGNGMKMNYTSSWINAEDFISYEAPMNELSTFSNEISTLFNNGWKLHSINGESFSWWIFKRPIEE